MARTRRGPAFLTAWLIPTIAPYAAAAAAIPQNLQNHQTTATATYDYDIFIIGGGSGHPITSVA